MRFPNSITIITDEISQDLPVLRAFVREFKLPGINQFQTNEKAGFTFASALRALLRQDPDVIMIGEIRDQETARLATQAALTGHLVLSTLHTNDAPGAVTRLFNLGIEPYLVGATVCGVLAQRLVRKICPHCREPHEPNPQEKAVPILGGIPSAVNLPTGCPFHPRCPYAMEICKEYVPGPIHVAGRDVRCYLHDSPPELPADADTKQRVA